MYKQNKTLRGHRQRIEEWLFSNDCGGQAMVGAVLDDIPEKFMWTKNYSVSFKSMNPRISESYGVPWQKGDIEIYTDGSKDDDGMAGGGCAPFKRVNEGYTFAYNGGNIGTHSIWIKYLFFRPKCTPCLGAQYGRLLMHYTKVLSTA